MMVLNDGTSTRINKGTAGASAPDVTIAHGRLLGRTGLEVTESLGSDHLCIVTEIDCGLKTLRERPRVGRRWNWRKADWPKSTSTVEAVLVERWESLHGESLDGRVEFLCQTILEAALTHVGEVKAKPSGKA